MLRTVIDIKLVAIIRNKFDQIGLVIRSG